MFKVLRQTLSMPQSQIETDIMFDAIKQICLLLETLYLETTKMNTSKYAKKRIKVDIKVFLKNESETASSPRACRRRASGRT